MFAYGGALQDAIRAWKNQPDESLGRVLGAALVGAVERLDCANGPCAALVVPIPSAPAALAKRGFNPAAALARPLARRLGLAYAPTALEVGSAPASSRGLGKKARAGRMRGVFRVRTKLVAGRDVLLVDDVMTTGATVAAATRACMACGARSVEVIVLARVPGSDGVATSRVAS